MARNEGEITVDGRDLMASLRIGVRLPRTFGIRMTIATCLFSLAGWVSGTNVAVEVEARTTGPTV